MAAHGAGSDVLFNNAGVSFPPKSRTPQCEIWEREAAALHAEGVFLGTPHGDPGHPQRRRRVRSSTRPRSWALSAVHLAGLFSAKGAIAIFTKSAALQYARENIRINSVHPGYADTPLTERRFNDPAVRQQLLDRTPMGRLGTAEDIANGVLFLASDESSWVTGSELAIDGRRSNRISVHGRAARRPGRPAGGRGHASRMARQGRGAKILRATALAGPGS